MPSATAGGWPYPLPTEPVRDGANNIKSLADKAQERLGNQMVVGIYAVASFDSNGLWYAPDWRQNWGNIYWDSPPAVVAVPGTYGTGAADMPMIGIYRPHNSATQMVLRALYAGSGQGFTGNIDLYIIAAGQGRRTA